MLIQDNFGDKVQFDGVHANGKIMPKWPSPWYNNKMKTFDKLYFLVHYCIIYLSLYNYFSHHNYVDLYNRYISKSICILILIL